LMCLIAGIYFAWKFLHRRKTDAASFWKNSWIDYGVIAILVWLLHMSNSQTSVFCLIIAVTIHFIGRAGFIKRKPSRLVLLIASSALLFLVVDSATRLRVTIYNLLGRNETLTDRTDLWGVVKNYETNSFVGTGFMSFWTGARMESIWADLGAQVNQAHNGYLEQYLNLGYIGVAFIILILLSAVLGIRKHLDVDPPAAILRFSFVITAILYNYTEASFYGLNNMWVLLLLGTLAVPYQVTQPELVQSTLNVRHPRVHWGSTDNQHAQSAFKSYGKMPPNRRAAIVPPHSSD